jgi:5-methylcytosine-specific restriction endonuclease McrA
MRPSPVVVRRLDGDEIAKVDQGTLHRRPCAPVVEEAARRAGFVSYEAFLQSGLWRRLRQETLVQASWRCSRCGTKKKLQVHHTHYQDLTSSSGLRVLCEHCHGRLHGRM